MDILNNMTLLIATEVLFVALVVVVVWLEVVRRRLRKARYQLLAKDEEITTAKKQLQHLEKIKKQKSVSQKSAPLNAPPKDFSQLIINYQQRIANLEKFKQLYFELEKHVTAPEKDDDSSADQIRQLELVIKDQDDLIDELKETLTDIKRKYELETKLTDKLNDTIDKLEYGSSKLRKQLDEVNRKSTLASVDAKELDYYKQRVSVLENTEKQIQNQLVEYKARVKELQAKGANEHPYGVVRIQELEEMKHDLDKKESEIRRLRKECETVSIQYEDLALRSLDMARQNEELDDDQKLELEQLKRMLQENSAALARKEAECEMLENCYLELEQTADVTKAGEDLQQSIAERGQLINTRTEINAKLEKVSADDTETELKKLQQILETKEQELQSLRNDYRELKEQFVEVAQEEVALRQSYQEIKQQYDSLRHEVLELRNARQELDDQQQELEKLRGEYIKLEARYLRMVEKYQS